MVSRLRNASKLAHRHLWHAESTALHLSEKLSVTSEFLSHKLSGRVSEPGIVKILVHLKSVSDTVKAYSEDVKLQLRDSHKWKKEMGRFYHCILRSVDDQSNAQTCCPLPTYSSRCIEWATAIAIEFTKIRSVLNEDPLSAAMDTTKAYYHLLRLLNGSHFWDVSMKIGAVAAAIVIASLILYSSGYRAGVLSSVKKTRPEFPPHTMSPGQWDEVLGDYIRFKGHDHST